LSLVEATRLLPSKRESKVLVKWPNDVLVADSSRRPPRKVAGVLAEVLTGDSPALVVGMGVNITWPDGQATGLPGASSLAAEGFSVDPNVLLGQVLEKFDDWINVLEEPEGAELLRAVHLEFSATVGTQVTVNGQDGVIAGTAIDIEEDGSLILQSDDGERTLVLCGDVSRLDFNGEDR